MEAIYEEGYEISLAITLKDEVAVNKSGRVYLDELCKKNNTQLIKVEHINEDKSFKEILSHDIDRLFVIGWSQLLSSDLIKSVPGGVYGMHPTLLPAGRGRAAIPWTILKKLEITGVSLFKIEEKVDSGALLLQDKYKIPLDIDATNLYKLSKESHVRLMKSSLPLFERDIIKEIIQDEQLATYWPQRKPEDGQIDLLGSIRDAEILIRAVTKPYPGAFIINNKLKTIIWKCTILHSKKLIPSGSKYFEFKDGILVCEEYEEHNTQNNFMKK